MCLFCAASKDKKANAGQSRQKHKYAGITNVVQENKKKKIAVGTKFFAPVGPTQPHTLRTTSPFPRGTAAGTWHEPPTSIQRRG